MLIPPKKNRNLKGLALIGTPSTIASTSSNNDGNNNSGNILISNELTLNSSQYHQHQRQQRTTIDSLPNSANTINSIQSNGSNSSSSRSDFNTTLTQQLKNLELGSTSTTSSNNRVENHHHRYDLEEPSFKLDLNSNKDLKVLGELGSGNGGTVSKCLHLTTNLIIAKKVVHIATSDNVRKQILRELQIMHDCNSKYIISFYGAYLSESHICMCMEFMDKGSLDNIYKKVGPIPEPILSKIALAVVTGLDYLYEVHKIMHRDVKPSNILLNSKGNIKICDFGVSGELINSVADTFVGTSTYMSPERISGDPYTVKSDVWSLGITLVELAIGRFPFSSTTSGSDSESDSEREEDQAEDHNSRTLTSPLPPTTSLPPRKINKNNKKSKKSKAVEGVSLSGSSHQMSILELLQYIVNEPAPILPAKSFGRSMEIFVEGTLRKEPVGGGKLKKGEGRPTPRELLEYDWLKEAMVNEVDVEGFARSIP